MTISFSLGEIQTLQDPEKRADYDRVAISLFLLPSLTVASLVALVLLFFSGIFLWYLVSHSKYFKGKTTGMCMLPVSPSFRMPQLCHQEFKVYTPFHVKCINLMKLFVFAWYACVRCRCAWLVEKSQNMMLVVQRDFITVLVKHRGGFVLNITLISPVHSIKYSLRYSIFFLYYFHAL